MILLGHGMVFQRGGDMEILTKDKYEKVKEAFLDQYSNDIKARLREEKKKYLDENRKDRSWQEFVKKCIGGSCFVFILIVAFCAYCAKIVSTTGIVGFALLQIFVFAFAYANWTDEVKASLLNAFADKEQGIVRDFIWSKMQDDVNKTSDEEKLQNVIQFYAVALYEIPRNTWFRYE